GAVHVHGDLTGAVQVQHRDAERLEALGAGLGTGDGAFQAALDLAQRVDEVVDGGTGADADDLRVIQVGQGGFGGSLLAVFGAHGEGGYLHEARKKIGPPLGGPTLCK